MAMVPALQFRDWQWLSLTLAAPVVVYGGLAVPPGRLVNLRHGAATMDTLISLGTLAAFGWSLWALFFGTAGEPGHDAPFEFTIEPQDGSDEHLPRGRRRGDHVHPRRPLLRGARQAPRRRRAARPAGARREGRRGAARTAREERIPVDQLAVGDRVRRPARREDRHRRRRSRRARSAVDASHADRRVGARWRSARATPSSARPSTPADGWSSARPGSAPTPSWPRWPGWSRRPRTARRSVQRLADRISGVFVPVVIALAVGTLGFWLGTGDGRRRRVHRRGRRADHRLPLRPRPGHPDRAAWSAPAAAPSSAS